MKFENQKRLDSIEARVKAMLTETKEKKVPVSEERLSEVNKLLADLVEVAHNEIKNNV